MKVKKKQITSTLNVATRDIADDCRILCFALKMFTKKRGALAKTASSQSQSGSAFSSLLDRLKICLARIQLVLSTKQSYSNLRVQMHLISPWVAQYERLLLNVVRVLNDRVAMLWRPKRSSDNEALLGEAFILHQDIALSSSVLKSSLQILCYFQSDVSANMVIRSPPGKPAGTDIRCTAKLSLISKSLISKILYFLKQLFPTITMRVESYVALRIKESVTGIVSGILDQNVRMYCVRSKDRSQLDHLILIRTLNERINSTVVTSLFNSNCTLFSKNRLLSATLGSCCESLLMYILEKRCRFNAHGVLTLYSQLQELLVCAGKIKEALLLPMSSLVVQNQVPWNRANAILQVLVVATATVSNNNNSNNCNISLGTSPLLAGGEYEAWLSLGRPARSCSCLNPFLSALNTSSAFILRSKRKTAVVSISPVLLTHNV